MRRSKNSYSLSRPTHRRRREKRLIEAAADADLSPFRGVSS